VNADKLLFNTKETALMLGINERTLEKMRQQGNGPDYVKLGKHARAPVRYCKADLEKYLAEHKRSNTSQQPLSSS